MSSALFTPASIALAGVSRRPGKIGRAILENLLAAGFPGRIHLVHPEAEEILGISCVPAFAKVPERPDLVILSVPAALTVSLAEEAARRGCKAMIAISEGFREKGEEGAALEKALAALCQARDIALIGPNCLGVIDAHARLNASFALTLPRAGGVSVISQSGALCTAILDWMAARRMGLAKMVSVGNRAGLDESFFLRALAQDEETRVIVCFLESIANGEGFLRAAEEAAGKKPVIIQKVGRSLAGRMAAACHTGSVAGEELAFGAAFKRVGAIRAESFDLLLDHLAAFSRQPLLQGDGVAVLTNGGGPGVMAADALERAGLCLPSFSAQTVAGLRGILPQGAVVRNPLDLLGDASPQRFAAALRLVALDPAVHGVMVLLAPQAMTRPAETARALSAVSGKPVVAAFMGGQRMREAFPFFDDSAIPNYSSPERAVAVLAAMRERARWLALPPRVVTRFPVNRRRVERIVRGHLRQGGGPLTLVETREVLAAYGFQVPPGELAFGSGQAVEIARRLGHPVVLTCAGGEREVRHHIVGDQRVADTFDLLSLRFARDHPGELRPGVLVEGMVQAGRAFHIGMTRDPQFGPMLRFGLGGALVELMRDVSFHLAPITADEALHMLRETRSFTLLEQEGGEAERVAVAESLQRISQLATDFPALAAIAIDPLMVDREGDRTVAVKAHMVVQGEAGP